MAYPRGGNRPNPFVAQIPTKTIRNPDAPATEPQIKFVLNLVAEREVGMDLEDFKDMIESLREGDALTQGWASARIEEYQALPKRAMPSVPPGYYRTGTGLDRRFFVVVQTRDKARTYAKELQLDPDDQTGKKQWHWVYVPGAVNALRGLTPLSVEEASEWGKLHGACIICGRHLEDPKSVKDGIGPRCARKVLASSD